jgi:hypothetical protein
MKLVIAVAAVLLLSGCAAASATTNVPDQITFATARPTDVPKRARAALDQLPPDSGRRHYGVVLAVTPRGTWYARVLGRRGVVVLSFLWDTRCHYQDDAWWRLQATPGDAVAWDSYDDGLCPGELAVVGLGAAS